MSRRLVWFGAGALSGGLAAVWGLSSIRRASQRLAPDRLPGELADVVADRSRSLGAGLRAAVADGRHAMAERERELLAALHDPPRHRRASGTGRSAVVR